MEKGKIRQEVVQRIKQIKSEVNERSLSERKKRENTGLYR